MIGTDEGIFGCMGLLACEDVCPKELPLQDELGILRRKMGWTAVKNLFRRGLKNKKNGGCHCNPRFSCLVPMLQRGNPKF